MIKKIVAVVMTAMMTFSFVGCGSSGESSEKADNINNNIEEEAASSGKIELLKQDNNLTQDQILSRIKAKKLIENQGYKDDDQVTVMVTLPQNSLVDSFNAGASKSFNTVADYAESTVGGIESQSIDSKQNALISQLFGKGLIDSVEYKYKTVTNAIAVKTSYGNIEKIKALASVEDTILSDTFNRPQSISVDEVNSIVNSVDVYETGIFNSGSLPQYDGDGTSVAILDSGFDCSHSVFQNSNIDTPMYSQSDIEELLSGEAKLNAAKTTAGLKVSDVYYSKKIPFKYDYADKDSDVFPYDSEHGTHVAGIIGGKDDVITGVAINTQLVLMKVFPDLQEGAETENILAALEDATLLGVDAINMSLGSSCGFAREGDNDWLNDVYDALKVSGISVITAASNSYSSAYGGEQGNTNMVSNPDSATVGSPSTYDACLSVASISGVKSSYLIGNDNQVLFFNESNDIAGDPNDFVKELGITEGQTKTFEYITVPGVGLAASYAGISDEIKGKIALVRRGSNTFEEKAQIAKDYGAIACIIYNNVDGDILMSMGKSDHIPTISISKDDGVKLADRDRGTLKIGYDQKAGPFMSDFSSWGPTPSLGIKPEITAHGGTIKSAVPGGGYDELSGTSMACPNLCGIVVLIRQYLKDNYRDANGNELSAVEYSNLCNQLLMSTATIIKNQEGNPYSPRKQGAGLASLYNAVTTKAIITVDGQDRPKLELKDDPERKGVYTLEFGVKNLSQSTLSYDVSLESMTESVSTSDNKHVAEKAYMLGGDVKVSLEGGDATLSGTSLTVNGGATAKIKIVYTMTKEDKQYITSSFPYGMFVEGFVKLTAKDDATEINLNAPYLAFFGDWTQAPMFDKTYYEVESQAHDQSIDDEDKLKADYIASTPYGSYMYNYIIPLGSYLYDLDTSVYDAIPATEEHAAISDSFGTIDGILAIYAGLLRSAKKMHFTVTDKTTGEVVWSKTDYNANKAYPENGTPRSYYESLKIKSSEIGLINNRQYEFRMQGELDYGDDGGLSTNVRNTFSFDFCLDNEAPIIKEASYEKVYDKSLKKDRYYITLTVYDNQYVQSISPIILTSTSSYSYLGENIPVYSNRGVDNRVRFEITDYLDSIGSSPVVGSALGIWIDDYALNSNLYLCQLPGTRGDFKFTSNGKQSGRPLNVITAYVGDVVDLTEYLYSSDATLDADKDYLKHLVWSTYNPSIIKADAITKRFKNGEAVCLKAGKTLVTVTEQLEGKQAIVTLNVKEREQTAATKKSVKKAVANQTVADAELESVDFTYFDTVFAYSRSAQTSEINETGSRIYTSTLNGGVSFYPGEKIKLHYDVKPWYIEENLKCSYTTSNEIVAKVEEDGTVTALKEGSALITLNVEGSNIKARIRITVKSEFVIENRMLIAYKGLGGKVVIPDDEGILYIGSYAFCLYDTDKEIELPEDDYDANKIPSTNTSVTSVVIPEGVSDIQKYAFYNCSNLKEVTLPSSIKFVREYSFYNDKNLTKINLENVEVVGAHAFHGCKLLGNVDLTNCYSIGASGFEGCESMTEVDITHLRNAAEETVQVSGGLSVYGRTFKDCISLAVVKMNENTKLCREMFVNTGLTAVDIYEKISIPTFAFAANPYLNTVRIHNDLISIDYGAFCDNPSLKTVEFKGSVKTIGQQVFFNTGLAKFTLPDCDVEIGEYCFVKSPLTTLILKDNTNITSLGAAAFAETNLLDFVVAEGNSHYAIEGVDDELLVSKDGKKIILAAQNHEYGDLVIDGKYEEIADGAFAGANIKSVTFLNKNIVIGDYAFNQCENLEKVTFAADASDAVVGIRAFNGCTALTQVDNLDKLKNLDKYAFANTGLEDITLAADAKIGEGAFFQSKVKSVTIGANSKLGMGVFQNCTLLHTVNMPEAGGVRLGPDCFANATSLLSIDLSKTNGIIAAETFYGCTTLSDVNLAGVTEVGAYAFADCASLKSVINAMSVKTIGEGAFSRQTESGKAPSFERIALDSVEEIGVGAFLGNEGLVEITIPETAEKVGDFAFAFCTALQSVELADTVTEIGMYAFRSCEQLYRINLGKVKTFGEYAFYGATYLQLVDLSSAETIDTGAFGNTSVANAITANNLVTIGEDAFMNANISSFTAPKLKSVGRASFLKNLRLTQFVFGTDIEYIGSMAFVGCPSLLSFAYMDGEEKKTEGEINGYASIYDGLLYTAMPSGKIELKAVPGGLKITTLTVKDGTARIDTYAGNRNENVTKIVLPDSLKAIGNYAFLGFKNLAEVEFKSYAAPVLETQFYYLKGEEDIFPEPELAADAPGYGLLHNQYDISGLELYYFNFKSFAGAEKPIKMTLSKNAATGYDGVIYEAYFGKVENAGRTQYVSMDASTADFVENAVKVAALDKVNLYDEKLINAAVTALNSMTQKLTDFGYTQEEADALIKAVRDAKTELTSLQIGAAGRDFRNIISKLNSLGATFEVSQIEILREVNGLINSLTTEDRILLQTTDEYKKYTALLSQYNEYRNGDYTSTVIPEGDEAASAAISAFAYSAAAIAATASVLGAAVFAVRKRLGL